MNSNIISLFLVCLPAMCANAIPVAVRSIPFLDIPISQKHLGGHKTWRGFVSGILISVIIVVFLSMVSKTFYNSYVMFFPGGFTVFGRLFFIIMGVLLGGGALLGDCIKSFFKRKIGIVSGASRYPRDQIDYIMGIVVITLPFHAWTIIECVICCGFGGLLSYAAHYSAYMVNMINTKH